LWFLGGLFVGFGLSTVQPLFPNVLPFNPTPMAALVMGLAHAQAFIRLRLLDVLPAALRTVFDHIQDAVIVFNERGEVVDSNPVARQLGTSATLAELLREYHSAAGDSVGAHIEIRRGDTLFDARLSPLKHREQLVGWLLVLRDITERRRMEKTLVENERIQAAYEKERELGDLKTRMMIRIAHEFRTPLAVILTSSESLERYNERMTAEQRRDKFRTIGKQIGHLSMMLDDLGMAVRSPTRQDRARTAFDLKALCDEVAGAFHKMNEGTHRLTLHTSEQKVCADEAGVRALLLNLLSNAAKYSPVGSDISLSAWGEDGDLWLRVCDSGIGICEPDQPHIFEPFYRGRNIDEVPGLGVGLTIVREIVRAHSGSITVRSIPGEETSFTVCLPGAAHALPAFVM
jgi:signal transduction histidine kinase